MSRMKIQETIVVEGRHDQAALARVVQANIVITHGNRLSKKTLDHLIELSKTTGIIVFTDPDQPGKTLRAKITEAIPDVKHAYLLQSKAHSATKIGIEHAPPEDLLDALSNLVTQSSNQSDLTMKDLLELGLSGLPDSQSKRNALASKLHLSEGNTKSFLKQCIYTGLTKEDLASHLKP